MRFEVTTDYLNALRKALKDDDVQYISEHVHELHAADIAEILDELSLEEGKALYKHLDEELAADVLLELDEDLREKILASLSSKEIAEQFIDNMDSDDAADVIGELSHKVKGEVLSHIEDAEQASDIVELLNYDEDTAGGLMATELIRVHVDSNVLECVREIRKQAEDVEHVYSIYVVDNNDKLLGLLSLKKLLISPLRSKVKDIYNPKIISVKTFTPSDEVGDIMGKYDLVVIPVVDHLDRLVGRITIDDVVDVIREEETEDVQKMGGMEALEEPYMNLPFLQMVKKRAGWLVILFLGESLTATVMGFYEGQIEKAVVLALFVPLIISSGGNTGSQASTLIIRALALNEISIKDWWKIVKKEFRVGLTLGCMLGAIGFLRVTVWSFFIDNYGPHWLLIASTIGLTLTGVVLWGSLMGSLLPLILKRMGFDPAVSSAPFVATMVDITGLVIYFTVATMFLRGILL
jgi:magnesium transporter